MARGKFYNVDLTPDNLRAIWSQLHQLSADLTDARLLARTQEATILALQTALDKTAKQAQQALIAAGSRTAAATSPGGGGGIPPVDPMPIPNHLPDVQAIWTAEQPTVHTLEWGWRVTRLLAWQFRNEVVEGAPFGMGLLLTGSGANLYTCNGLTYKVGRVVYPNGAVRKILTDIPGTMDPSWQVDGFVDVARYSPSTDPAVAC